MSFPYLVLRKKQYYFQIRLPVDIQPFFQSSQLKKSLRTASYREAVTLVKLMSSDIEKVFFMIRSGLLTNEMVQQIVSDYKEGVLDVHRKSGRKGE